VDELLLGMTLGLGAGLAPGPLLALLLGATLRGGFPAGARVAAAPLVTDTPLIALCVLVLAAVPASALGALGLLGGAVCVWLGVDALRGGGGEGEVAAAGPGAAGDLRRGALVNVLSPHPWLFWIAVGGPILAGAGGVVPAAAFLAGFYAFLVGTKLALAALLAAGRDRFAGPRAARVAAVLLVVAAVVLALEGLATLRR